MFAETSAKANGGTAPAEALDALKQVKRRAMGFPFNSPNAADDGTSATADQIFAEKCWELTRETGKQMWEPVRVEKVAEAKAHWSSEEDFSLLIDPSAISLKQYIAPVPFQAIATIMLIQNPPGFKIH